MRTNFSAGAGNFPELFPFSFADARFLPFCSCLTSVHGLHFHGKDSTPAWCPAPRRRVFEECKKTKQEAEEKDSPTSHRIAVILISLENQCVPIHLIDSFFTGTWTKTNNVRHWDRGGTKFSRSFHAARAIIIDVNYTIYMYSNFSIGFGSFEKHD